VSDYPFTMKAEAEIARLRHALEKVMVGGNHLVTIIGVDHPPHTATHDAAMNHYGVDDYAYDAWCCWRAIMEARAALEPKP
jgi:hypothetical protein